MLKALLDHLHYRESSSDLHFGEHPSNELDVPRLMDNKPAWVQLAASITKKPKTLILADDFFEFTSDDKQKQVTAILKNLCQQDFKLYIWTNTGLYLLTEQVFDDQNWFKGMRGAFSEEIIAEASKQGISRDSIQIIDDYWRDCLLYDEILPEHSLYVSELYSVSKQRRAEIVEAVSSKHHPSIILVQDCFDQAVMDQALTIKSRLPSDTSIKEQYRTLRCTVQELEKLLHPLHTDLNIEGRNFTYEMLKSLDNINIETTYDTDLNTMKTMLLVLNDIVPNLRSLRLTHARYLRTSSGLGTLIDLSINADPGTFIDLSGNQVITGGDLENLLQVVSNLKGLVLRGCKKINIPALDLSRLAQLEVLDLAKTNVTSEDLGTFLQAAPNLKELTLAECGNIKDISDIDLTNLGQLKVLDLSSCPMSVQSLEKLLSAVPKLHNLKWEYCCNIKDISGVCLASLGRLETLDLSHTRVTTQVLKNILRAAPQLKTLSLWGCSKIKDISKLEVSSLAQLEKLNLGYTKLTQQDLNEFFKVTPQLKKLTLCGCENIKDIFKLGVSHLVQLEELSVEHSPLIGQGLKEFLDLVPNLKALSLDGFYWAEDWPDLELSKLGHLESLSLINYRGTTTRQLTTFLRAAPNLKKLYFMACNSINMELNLKENSLSQLAEVIMPFNELSIKNLEMTARAAPLMREEILPIIVSRSKPLFPFFFKPTLELPRHDPSSQKDFIPHDESKPFEFKEDMPFKNQGMVINKLSQYLTQKKQHVAMIPKLQDGICKPLSLYFKNKGHEALAGFLNEALAWDGDGASLTDTLCAHFDALYTDIDAYQLKNIVPQKHFYLGANIGAYLENLPLGRSAILVNPWHAIAIKKDSSSTYWLYDPNADGVKHIYRRALKKALSDHLGALIGIMSPEEKAEDINDISDVSAFIEHGGLLVLCKCHNFTPSVFETISKASQTLDKTALEGILLRGTSGQPAWVVGLGHTNPHVKNISQILLQRFKDVSAEDDAEERLSKSMDVMTGMHKQVLAESLCEADRVTDREIKVLREEIVRINRKKQARVVYQEALSPWVKPAEEHTNILSYNQTLLQVSPMTGSINRLVRCCSSEALMGLTKSLVSHAESTHQQVFYIDAPEDLICSAPYVEREGDVVHFKKGPGGALHEFLEYCRKENIKPILVINYTRFNASNMVKFNGVLDSVDPRADGTPLPGGTRVIGLMNTADPDAYQGSDFYSRFHEKYDNPFSEEALFHVLRKSSIAEEKSDERVQPTVIELFNGRDWKAQLLGTCRLDGHDIRYENGVLMDAIAKGGPIEVRNGPQDDPEFQAFWEHLTIGQGIYHAGQWHKMPHTQEMWYKKGYDWQTLTGLVNINSEQLNTKKSLVLNARTLSRFLGGYVYDEKTKTFTYTPSQLNTMQNSRVFVHVTGLLSDDVWARVLTACKHQDVTLEVHCAPGVELPHIFGYEATEPAEPKAFNFDVKTKGESFNLILSSDSDTTCRMIQTQDKNVFVMSVSGLSPEDLLYRIDTLFDHATAELSLERQTGPLIEHLQEGKKVILTGNFSSEMVQALADFVLSQDKPPKLTLISEDIHALSCYLSPIKQHKVTSEEKKRFLSANDDLSLLSDAWIESEPLSRLEARLRYLEHHEGEESDQAWAGMHSLSSQILVDNTPLDFNQSSVQAKAFECARLDAVTQHLAKSPYVYLTGLTGVGKTTFVQKAFSQENGYALFHEADAIASWAKAEGKPVLFLDEANMSARDWGMFEGLFHEPPGIIEHGTYYLLSSDHKVIFAGNPNSYGDERKKDKFFERHGAAVLLQPLSKAVLYEDVLKPIFEEQGFSDEDIQTSVQAILDAYARICHVATEEVLITPRELQMIALLGLTNAKQQGTALQAHIKSAIVSICTPILEDKPALLAQLKAMYSEHPNRQKANAIGERFYVTPSLEPIVAQLQNYLALRNWRVTTSWLNEAQWFGGVGGMVLEGEPGCGKSELIVHTLVASGFEEEHDYENTTKKPNPFYKIPASMGLKQKKSLLEKAFHEGAVVIMDEINSSAMMEHDLNAMLMGLHPKTHERPKNPGFMVLGTQNPISMAGRRVASPALRRRISSVGMPESSKDELINILRYKTRCSEEDAGLMVDSYIEQRTYAKQQRLSPVPCFRDLMTLAERVTHTADPLDLSEKKSLEEMNHETHSALDNDSSGEPNREQFRATFKAIQDGRQLGIVLQPLSKSQRSVVLETVQEHLHQIIKYAWNLNHALLYLSGMECRFVLKTLQERLPHIIQNGKQLGLVLRHLSGTQCRIVLEILQAILPQVIQDTCQLSDTLKLLSTAQRSAVLALTKERLPKIIQSGHQLGIILQYLSERQCCVVLTTLQEQERLPQVIQGTRQLSDTLKILSVAQRSAVLEFTKERLPKIIQSSYELGIILRLLSKAQQDTVLKAIQGHLPQLIQDGRQLGLALQYLSETQCRVVLEIIQDDSFKIIRSGRHLGDILRSLSYGQCRIVLEVLQEQGRLSRVIQDGRQLSDTLRFLSVAQRSAVLVFTKERLPKIIQSNYELGIILQLLSQDQKDTVLRTMEGKLHHLREGEQKILYPEESNACVQTSHHNFFSAPRAYTINTDSVVTGQGRLHRLNNPKKPS